MSKYNNITLNECLALNERVGITFNINDGHVTSINTEEVYNEWLEKRNNLKTK